MGSNSPTDPLDSGHDLPVDPFDVIKNLMPQDLSPQEHQLVHSLLGALLPVNMAQSVVPMEAQSDRDLLKHLQNHVQTASTIVDLLAQREIGRNHLPTMRQLELQLVAMTPNISDLEEVLESQSSKQSRSSEANSPEPQSPPEAQSLERKTEVQHNSQSLKQSLGQIRAVQFWLNLRPRSRGTILACLIAALAPIAVRWGGPRLIDQVEQTGLIKEFSSSATSTVKTIDGNTWMVAPPNQPIQSLQLAGIQPIDSAWITESNSILRMIVSASGNQVSVALLPHSSRALLRLPTGLMLQEVLVREGFAKVDANQLSSLPKDAADSLEQAQAKAEAQRQNVWGNE